MQLLLLPSFSLKACNYYWKINTSLSRFNIGTRNYDYKIKDRSPFYWLAVRYTRVIIFWISRCIRLLSSSLVQIFPFFFPGFIARSLCFAKNIRTLLLLILPASCFHFHHSRLFSDHSFASDGFTVTSVLLCASFFLLKVSFHFLLLFFSSSSSCYVYHVRVFSSTHTYSVHTHKYICPFPFTFYFSLVHLLLGFALFPKYACFVKSFAHLMFVPIYSASSLIADRFISVSSSSAV